MTKGEVRENKETVDCTKNKRERKKVHWIKFKLYKDMFLASTCDNTAPLFVIPSTETRSSTHYPTQHKSFFRMKKLPTPLFRIN